MTTYDRHLQILAACLAAVAGYCDAIGFLYLNGYFVSFMSGNSTQFGVGLADSTWMAPIAGGLVALFVIGVMIGSAAGRVFGALPRMAVICSASVLVGLAASFGAFGAGKAAIAALTLAMGAMNGVFEKDGEVRVGVTYMTGTLVKVGQHGLTALLGGPRFAWVPYLALWMSLVAGAIFGGFAYPYLGLSGLWPAFVALVASAIAAYEIGRSR